MTEFLANFFVSIFGSNSIFATTLISMLPIIELKGAIPIGMSVDYWGEFALTNMEAFLFSLLGSCIVVPIVALIFTPILNFLKRTRFFKNIGKFIDEKVKKHSEKIDGQAEEKSSAGKVWFKALCVFGFVAIPLPLTGVWTGTCVAVAIGLKFWQTCVSVILGNIVAGLIIMFVCSIFPEIITILSIVFLSIVLAIIIWLIVKIIIRSKKNKKVESENQEEDTQA